MIKYKTGTVVKRNTKTKRKQSNHTHTRAHTRVHNTHTRPTHTGFSKSILSMSPLKPIFTYSTKYLRYCDFETKNFKIICLISLNHCL